MRTGDDPRQHSDKHCAFAEGHSRQGKALISLIVSHSASHVGNV